MRPNRYQFEEKVDVSKLVCRRAYAVRVRDEAKEIPKRPDVPHRYTDAGGFSAIVKQGILRATDIRFLNDPLELKYAWAELLVALEAAKSEKPQYSEAYDAVLQAISMTNAVGTDSIEDRIFSTSFSEDGDELNQWHRYADEARGMALGFDFESIQMRKVPIFYHTSEGQLVPVLATISGMDDKVPMTWPAILQPVRTAMLHVRKPSMRCYGRSRKKSCDENSVGTTAQKVVDSLFRLPLNMSMLALVKKKTYRSELEWRITIAEHFGNSSLAMKKAFAEVPEYP